MKCPHCEKVIDADPNSAAALFILLRRNVLKSRREYRRWADCHGVDNPRTRKKDANVQKWEAWTKWVEEQIAKENKK